MGQIRKSLGAVLASAALLFLSAEIHAQATDVDCEECVDASDIAAGSIKNNKIAKFAVQSDKIAKQAVTSPKIAPGAVTTGKIAAGAVTIDKLAPELDLAALDIEIQMATDFGRRGEQHGRSALIVLERLISTLGLSCAEANYGYFFGCTQITAGDGTVWPIAILIQQYAIASVVIEGVDPQPGMATPRVYMAQTNSGPGDMIVAGTANLFRWTYRDPEDTSRLVDDCDNPTVAMSPISLGGTSGSWRVNNGGYYYTPYNEATGRQDPLGQIDVKGQTVGIVKNIGPFGSLDSNSIVWCEMSNQVTGVFNTYQLLPYPFDLNEARFSLPLVPN